MPRNPKFRGRRAAIVLSGLLASIGPAVALGAGLPPVPNVNPIPSVAPLPRPMPLPASVAVPSAPGPGEVEVDPNSLLNGPVEPIDLGTALRLGGVQNPGLLVARQLVIEAVAVRKFAAVQLLPTLNGGANYDAHTGNVQQSSGNILSVNRSAVYVGAGAFATAAGTVNIPGAVLTGNVAEGVYRYLVAKQDVRRREFARDAVGNQVLLRVATEYCDLIRAEGRRAVLEQVRSQSAEVARITAVYARTGQGRQADADRSATELARRRADVRQAEGQVLVASAKLCRTLNLDPSVRLHPTDAYAVPMPIVPDPVPLCELIAIALMRRPELGERRAAIQEALLTLHGAKALPFSPTILLAVSGGGFGGGSNLVRPRFGNFGDRADFDTFAYWTAQNLGLGNLALIRIAKSQLNASKFQELAVLDQVRDEVAEAYARTHARYAEILDNEQAVRSAIQGFAFDLERIKQGVPGEGRNPRPIEVLNSLDLLRISKLDYLDAIVDYNIAHFQTFVAIGQPPSPNLAQPVPTGEGGGEAATPPSAGDAPYVSPSIPSVVR